MSYKIYGDTSANPSAKWDCQIGTSVDSLLEAVDIAQNTPYSYVDIVGPDGNVIDLEMHKSKQVNFLLFAGDNYYPCGGYEDLKHKAATEDELREVIESNRNKSRYGSGKFDWWQIVNANTHVIVDKGYY